VGQEPSSLVSLVDTDAVVHIDAPHFHAVGRIVEVHRRHLLAAVVGPVPPPSRVRIRINLQDALLIATARLHSPIEIESPVVRLDEFAGLSKAQRRGSERLPEPVRVVVKADGANGTDRVLPAVNLSGRGLLLGWPDRPKVSLGEVLTLALSLDEAIAQVTGTVVRVDDYHTAIRFPELPETVAAAIADYIARRRLSRNLIDDPFANVE
jgi:hypothetical protein